MASSVLDSTPDTETGLLTVVGIMPQIQSPDTLEYNVLEKNQVILPCQVIGGVPTPEIRWYHMENEVDTDRTMVGEDNSLIIYSANADDTGMYVCKVVLIESFF